MNFFEEAVHNIGLEVAKIETSFDPRKNNHKISSAVYQLQNVMSVLRHKMAQRKIKLQEQTCKILAIAEEVKEISHKMFENMSEADEVFPQLSAREFNLDDFLQYDYGSGKSDLTKFFEYAHMLLEFICFLTALANVHYHCTHFKKRLEDYQKNVRVRIECFSCTSEKISLYEKFNHVFCRLDDFHSLVENEKENCPPSADHVELEEGVDETDS